jgi:hypothetical protein
MGLVPASPPEGVRLAPAAPSWRPAAGAPYAAHEVVVVAAGALALAAGPGVARTLRLPGLQLAFDRRPPGLSRVAGAPLANAGLLLDADGWRAVVLPSLGDLLPGLGAGPVALRPDGRRVAFATDGSVVEVGLPGGEVVERHDGETEALAYLCDGRLVAGLGGAVGPPGGPARDGSPIVALAAAASAARVLARHADGTLSLWDADADTPASAWTPPVAEPLAIGLSADGELAAVGTPAAEPAAAAVLLARDGSVLLGVAGARALAFAPRGRGLLAGGEWGVMWLEHSGEEE